MEKERRKTARRIKKRHVLRFGSALAYAAAGVVKLVSAAFEASYFVSVYGFYSLAVAFAKAIALRGEISARGDLKKERKYYFVVAATLAAASALYIFYSARLFFRAEPFAFDLIFSIGIAAVSFSELIAASVGLSRANRRKDILSGAVRCVNLSSAFYAIALTQTALLSIGASGSDVSIPAALGGVVFGAASLTVAIAMLLRSPPSARRGGKRKVKYFRSVLTRQNLRAKLSEKKANGGYYGG